MKRSVLLLTLAALCGVPASRPAAAQASAGEFQVGDRVLLRVEGDSLLTDTFTVIDGPALRLPVIGDISLAGVRRADLEAHLVRELSRYLKAPVVRARALIRLSVLGEVVRPGFYAVATDLVVADALMLAGGPTLNARVDKLRIQRGDQRLWTGDRLQAAVAEGATVDALGLRAGDQIVVPRGRDTDATVRLLSVLISIPIAIYGIKELF